MPRLPQPAGCQNWAPDMNPPAGSANVEPAAEKAKGWSPGLLEEAAGLPAAQDDGVHHLHATKPSSGLLSTYRQHAMHGLHKTKFIVTRKSWLLSPQVLQQNRFNRGSDLITAICIELGALPATSRQTEAPLSWNIPNCHVPAVSVILSIFGGRTCAPSRLR